MAPAALGLAYALGNRGQTLLLIAIGCAGMLPYLLSEVFFGGLTGMQRIARPAMWQVVQTYFPTVGGILVLELGGGVVPFTDRDEQRASLIPMTATAFMVRPFVRGHRVVDFRLWRLLVVGGAPLLALDVPQPPLRDARRADPARHRRERTRRLVRRRPEVGRHPVVHHDRRRQPRTIPRSLRRESR